MRSDEIRETFLSFFEERGSMRVPSSSLIPSAEDTSTLLTVAGMQQFKPYFEGREEPPARRLTSSQRTLSHRRHRGGRDHEAPPHLLRDARQLLDSATTSRLSRCGSAGSSRPEGSGSTPSRSGSRSSRATRPSGSAPTRNRSRSGARSACPTSGSCACRRPTTSGRGARPAPAARARRCTSTVAPSSEPTTCAQATTRIATSSTGTTCS